MRVKITPTVKGTEPATFDLSSSEGTQAFFQTVIAATQHGIGFTVEHLTDIRYSAPAESAPEDAMLAADSEVEALMERLGVRTLH